MKARELKEALYKAPEVVTKLKEEAVAIEEERARQRKLEEYTKRIVVKTNERSSKKSIRERMEQAKKEQERKDRDGSILKLLQKVSYSPLELRSAGFDLDVIANAADIQGFSSNFVSAEAGKLLKGAVTTNDKFHRIRIVGDILKISRVEVSDAADGESCLETRGVIWGTATHKDMEGEIEDVEEGLNGTVKVSCGNKKHDVKLLSFENPIRMFDVGQRLRMAGYSVFEMQDWANANLRADGATNVLTPQEWMSRGGCFAC